jgi:predicted ATPase/DNA-binding SARP family transcriptional activator/tetratricopeptide (TPR) repeat protein
VQNPSQDILRFLGPLELVIEGTVVDPGGPNQRALLAYLVLHRGEPVTIPTIIDAVWGDGAPDGAVRSLRTYVSNLRRLLGSTAEIRGEQGTYRLTLAGLGTDIDLFRRGVERAGATEEPKEIVGALTSALALWRGPFLVDLDRPWVFDESSILESQRANAVARWAEATIADGEPESVIPQIEPMVADSPLDERLNGILMRALYRSGRQADALAVYRHLRNALADELGVQPGPELRNLEEQILLHEVAVDGGEPRWLLPVPVSDLVGRSVEIEDLLARIEQVRLLTLTGPGGVGKTRLALEIGRRIHTDGTRPVFFADLSAVPDESAVDAVLASSVGVQPKPDAGPLASLIEYLAPRSAVFIVDNCEHVTDAAARAVASLVRGCPQLTVVATSRSSLFVDGELDWHTPSLALPDRPDASRDELLRWPAIELLLQRAPGTFELTDANGAGVVELCRSLDGLPLALEIAASHLGSMTPAEIVAALGSQVQLARSGASGDSRHATLGAIVGWSYGLLSRELRELLVRLGVMSGRFLFEDVLAVCAPEAESPEAVRRRLSRLVDQSLVMAETSGKRTRYRMLETIRRFAIDHLGHDEPAVRDRHACHFAGLAEVQAARLLTNEEGDAIEEMSSAHDNLRGAFGWAMRNGDLESASTIVISIPDGGYWRSRNELVVWSRSVWQEMTPTDRRWRAVSGTAARGAWMESRFDDAVMFAREAAEAEGIVPSMCGYPEDVLADIALYRGDAKTALLHYSGVVEAAREQGDLTREAWATYYVSVTNAVLGRSIEAGDAAVRALAVARNTGTPTSLAFALYANGLAVKHEKPEEAIAMFEEAVEMADSVRNEWVSSVARMELASVNVAHGDVGEGYRDFALVVDHWFRAADDTQLRLTWRYLSRTLAEVGLYEEAAVLSGALLAQGDSGLVHPHRRVLEGITSALGDAQYRRLTIRGSIMSVPELVTVSLDAIDRAIEFHEAA